MKIHGIDVTGEAGQELMRMVHEALGMGCWHEYDTSVEEFGDIPDRSCIKCGHEEFLWGKSIIRADLNPDYLNSLDAYRPIWEKLTKKQHNVYRIALYGVIPEDIFGYCAQPHHHLEALASVLRVECDECGGYGTNCGDIYEETCDPCQGEGTRTIISIWEARYGIRSTKGE